MRKVIIFFVMLLFLSSSVFACAKGYNGKIIKNRIFAISMPNEFKGSYISKIQKDKISIFDKDSKKAGFGGFAFGIKAYKNPADHAVLPGSRKIGELVDKKGILYDMVIKYPTDVQFDYTKGENPPLSYKHLYDYGEQVNIKGINGSTYYKNQGMKGQDLYSEILKKHILAIKEKWDSNKLEKENMSYMYNVIASAGENPLDKIGYTYYDMNADGIEELLIGEISEGNFKGVIYDIYTMVDRIPKHVISGGNRDRYFVCDNSFVCEEFCSGDVCATYVYILVENSTELFWQVGFKYDNWEDYHNPWFIKYGGADWSNIDQDSFKERKKVFERYERFDFIPLNSIKMEK